MRFVVDQKAARLTVPLLILKRLYHSGDKTVSGERLYNPYME
jgi:hypothetical protein